MTRSANPLRGEASFKIDDKALILRPTFEKLVAAEEELGSLFELVERASRGALTLAEITGLLWHCLSVDERPEREVVGANVVALGLVKATAPIRVILAQALQGKA